jgi:hypothetical protein
MAITATRVGQGPGRNLPFVTEGNTKRTVTDIALDSSYLSGGEPVTAGDLGLNSVNWASSEPTLSATTTVNIAFAGYDPATSLLHVYDESPAEVASTAATGGAIIRIVARGA